MTKAAVLSIIVAGPMLSSAVWYKENLAFGLRDAILLKLAIAPSDPATMYLTTTDGYVFSTHNGGLAWNEARLIVEGESFFGQVRSPDLKSVDISAEDVLPGGLGELGSFRLQDDFYFEFGTTGEEFLDTSLYPTGYDAAAVPGLDAPGDFRVYDSGGGHGSGGDASRLGVGLSSGAPRLKSALRELETPSVGMNLQQYLVEMGVEETWVNSVAVHPRDPMTALAATSMGAFKTTDGGIGWIPVFGGTDKWERDGQVVAFEPGGLGRVYLGTQSGLFVSDDSGERFDRVTGTQLESAYVTAITPVMDKDGGPWVYVGTTDGAFLSRDRGESWKWVYYETLPEANFVSSIAVDSADPGHVLVSTLDGIFATFDAGQSWDRTGGLLFTNEFVPTVLLDPDDGAHAVACTEHQVWETRDRGATWETIYIDDGDWKIAWMLTDPHEVGTLWVVAAGELLRLRSSPPALRRGQGEEEFRRVLTAEPSESEVLDAVFSTLNVSPGKYSEYAGRATAASLLPDVRAVGGVLSARSDAAMTFVPWLKAYSLASDHVFVRGNDFQVPYFGLMAWWDFSNFVFNVDSLSFGRAYWEALDVMYSVKYETARYYDERVRLMHALMVERPDKLEEALDQVLRYRELTEHLNALTGGMYEQQVRQLDEGGVEWLQGYPL